MRPKVLLKGKMNGILKIRRIGVTDNVSIKKTSVHHPVNWEINSIGFAVNLSIVARTAKMTNGNELPNHTSGM